MAQRDEGRISSAPVPVPVPEIAAESGTGTGTGSGRGLLSHLGRHQIASLVSTAVDFGAMVLSVELLGLSAVTGTVAGASCGAVTNFQLGRHFTFDARDDGAAPQAFRYAMVSASSSAARSRKCTGCCGK